MTSISIAGGNGKTGVRKVNPNVFLKAAKIVADPDFDEGCCSAIAIVLGNNYEYCPEYKFFYELFPWRVYEDGEYWNSWGNWHNVKRPPLQREARVLALLICYWEAKWQK